MSNGVNKARLEKCKCISVKDYLFFKDPDKYRLSKDGQSLIYKSNPDYVIYDNHGYIFTDGCTHPRRDNIDVIRDMYGYGFIEAVEVLEKWQASQTPADDDGFMTIPDGIDLLIETK